MVNSLETSPEIDYSELEEKVTEPDKDIQEGLANVITSPPGSGSLKPKFDVTPEDRTKALLELAQQERVDHEFVKGMLAELSLPESGVVAEVLNEYKDSKKLAQLMAFAMGFEGEIELNEFQVRRFQQRFSTPNELEKHLLPAFKSSEIRENFLKAKRVLQKVVYGDREDYWRQYLLMQEEAVRLLESGELVIPEVEKEIVNPSLLYFKSYEKESPIDGSRDAMRNAKRENEEILATPRAFLMAENKIPVIIDTGSSYRVYGLSPDYGEPNPLKVRANIKLVAEELLKYRPDLTGDKLFRELESLLCVGSRSFAHELNSHGMDKKMGGHINETGKPYREEIERLQEDTQAFEELMSE